MESTGDRLPHGYTNLTSSDGSWVTKRFTGPQVAGRLAREASVLRAIASVVPVPAVRDVGDDYITMRHMPGTHGQDMLNPDTAARVLAACGRVLARVHAVPAAVLPFARTPDDAARGRTVLVHGDFGPNNVLLDTEGREVTAVFDWEWARLGRPVEDLAWCEWVVRMHHPDCVEAMPHLFHGYGTQAPAWAERRGAMLARIRELLDFCASPAGPQGAAGARAAAVAEWRRRLAVTTTWRP
ncbi:phosphotransferase [Phytomonospora sp. NPDC050363]|uniref:phosphotransferase family protein n=1 Tax=Phytomonospora sp. NPDC050363 TaxID=3155642 RepID=UPI003401C7DC